MASNDHASDPLAADCECFVPVHALTQEQLISKLQAAGYSEVSDIKSTAEGTAVRALKRRLSRPAVASKQ